VGIFGRRSKATDKTETDATGAVGNDTPGQDVTDGDVAAAGGFDRAQGPFDLAEAPRGDEHLDLGALRVLGVEGMQLRLEIDQEQQQVIAATAVLGDSSLQLQAFAAPRSGGLWAEIRDEIAGSVATRGGTAEVTEGPLGTELRTRMPSQDAAGRTVFAPARFVGVDGPRWFLRGVLTGRSAINDESAKPLLDLFRSTIVVRGTDPMAPRELLPLTLPQEAEPATATPDGEQPGDTEGADTDGGERRTLNPFERGPEITEVR
jgi:hypothetical protein